jgi:hypothetical protein
MYYNFGRIHKPLRTTSAAASGHVWSLEEIAEGTEGTMPSNVNYLLTWLAQPKLRKGILACETKK